MENYSSNSNKSKEAANASLKEGQNKEHERRVETVVKTGTLRQKGKFKKFVEEYASERFEDAKKFVIQDVIQPAVKEMIASVVSILVYGEPGRISTPRGGPKSSVRRSYDQDYKRSRSTNDHQAQARPRNAFENEDIIFPTYGDAEYVLEELRRTIENYDIVRVLDFYDACDLTPPATGSNFGWTNLDGVKPVKLLDGSGYYLPLPRPMPID